ncbi:hypothetical protein JOF53_002691 [Crossiella equi]|uniref:DUF402 domain-containing protein n=1 Tax=Crossiella equi TaxID=130796 RepID=A0ABS5AB71_9PSEU|nr:DUF402 domain-containing protein [Crossiella equi]MBP2473819.1 hypothetical protein [Crossiella equi]
MTVWQPGEQVLYRFRRLDGSLGSVTPARVLADDGAQLVCWIPDGTPVRATRLADGRHQREAPLAERFRLPRVPVLSSWHGHSNLRLVDENAWSSVWWFFEPDGRFRHWYVNLEIPVGRGEGYVDRVDGVLDVVVEPDRGWEWKDEDEAEEAVAAGMFTAGQMARLRAEGERMIALAERGAFPFDGSWCDFAPEPEWPKPVLPEEISAGLPVV